MSNPFDGSTPTPPHRPTYKVRLTSDQIESICSLVFPSHTYSGSIQLPSDASYNNRIYFVTMSAVPSNSHSVSTPHLGSSPNAPTTPLPTKVEYALKLSGHYFGRRKVQNEVSALLLLAKYCPSLPVPRVIAWSEDGSKIRTATENQGDTLLKGEGRMARLLNDARSEQGWILITKLPGRVLTKEDLNGEWGETLLRQAARYLGQWRNTMPAPKSGLGNMRFHDPDEQVNEDLLHLHEDKQSGLQRNETVGTPQLTTGGLVLSQNSDPSPFLNAMAYYTFITKDQHSNLRRFTQLGPLLLKIDSLVQDLIDAIPSFTFFQPATQGTSDEGHRVRFSHLDFAPRNILISNDQETNIPYVSGILDFEFSAFLSGMEEFTNMTVRQPDDWTSREYDILTNELVSTCGLQIPHLLGQGGKGVCVKKEKGVCSCDDSRFEGLGVFVKVVEHIAPWWINSSYDEVQKEEAYEESAVVVREGVERLFKDFVV